MAPATSCISTAASVSSTISKARELSQASISLSLSVSLSLSPSICVCVFLHKTYEFVSFVWDKMKQTELGEVIGALRQERRERGGGGQNGYAICLRNDHRFRAPLGGIW